MVATEKERKDFADKMIVTLMLNNYGFTISDGNRPKRSDIVTFDNVESLKAIRELKVRLNLFVATGQASCGSIQFPEANREIEYIFNPEAIAKCSIKLKALSDWTPYIYR